MNDLIYKVRKRSSFYTFLLCSLVLNACSSADSPIAEEDPNHPSKAVKVVKMSTEDILSGNNQSRTSFTLESDKLNCGWAEGDKIGVCPTSGTQIAFTIKSGVGENTATFDGGAWALRDTETYAAYYPYDVNNTANTNAEIRFSYEGQCQKGNASMSHLGAYDLMATDATHVEDDELNFLFKHLNSVAQLRLTVPVAATFKNLAIRCNDGDIFAKTANLDLSGETYAWTAVETTDELQMNLSDIASTEAMKDLVFYMMLPPTDMAGKTVTVVLQSDDNKVYQGQLASKTLKAGYAYSFGATLVDVTVSSQVTSPNFGSSEIN